MESIKTFTVYVLRTSAGTLYTGYTNNLKKRIKEHSGRSKRSSKYMRSFPSFRLVFFEEFSSKSEAMKREYEIKQLSKNEKEKLIDMKS